MLFVGYFSIQLYSNNMLTNAKENVIENNPEITNVVSINNIGKWGEWFTEYVLVVEINGLKYRIWTSNEGEISDKIPL
ncbi:hypothetical protein [Solibacillus sp. CAU 1738]|uniref:hypothetical protein n=1 Tax=Solibacillus sp. CAU 1738 TaxID=3140363 RepID=UPI00326152FB